MASANLTSSRVSAMLRPGDRVVTSDGSRAVLTFLDGSTVTLEANTDVTINSVLDERGQVLVKLTQERGETWTHVPPDLGARQIEIDTPTARVQTNEAAFSTSVEPASGRTEVGAGSGSIQVSSGSQRTDVTGGNRTSVDTAGVVAPTSAAAPVRRELVVRIAGPALGFVTDASGATAGVLLPGYTVSQISGASVSRDEGTIVIRIPEPAPGAFRIGLHGSGSGTVQVGVTAGGISEATTLSVADGQDWSIKLDLGSQALALGVPAQQDSVAAGPANVAIPERIIAAATAVAAKEPTQPPPSKTPAPSATPTRTPVKALTAVPIPQRSIDNTDSASP